MRQLNLDMSYVESIKLNDNADTMRVCTHHSLQSSSAGKLHSLANVNKREEDLSLKGWANNDVEIFIIVGGGIAALFLALFLIWLWWMMRW